MAIQSGDGLQYAATPMEPSAARLRKKLDNLLKDADVTTLQQAAKLMRALKI